MGRFYLSEQGSLEEDDEASSCTPSQIADHQEWIIPSLVPLLPLAFSRQKLNCLTCRKTTIYYG